MGILGTVLRMVAVWEGTSLVKENIERSQYYTEMRDYSLAVGKPLLMVGMPRWAWQPQTADVILDLDPSVEGVAGGVVGNVLAIPFPDKYFGGAYVAHVLEHMYTVEECEQAINECVRVSERVAFLCPNPNSLIANIFMPSHHLRLFFDQANNRIKVTENRYRTGMGIPSRGGYEEPSAGGIGQSLIVESLPEIVRIGNAYII